MQQTGYWCVPASTRATISAFNPNLPSQSSIANAEHTTTSGTYITAAPAVINGFESRNSYITYTQAASGNDVFSLIEADIDNYQAPLIPAIWGGDLTLWAENGYVGHHAITLYGHSDTNNIHYFDPVNVNTLYGPHTTTSAIVYQGMADNGGTPSIVF